MKHLSQMGQGGITLFHKGHTAGHGFFAQSFTGFFGLATGEPEGCKTASRKLGVEKIL